MLSEHPHIEKRLRQEIFDVVGQTGRPTYDQMHKMKYMKAFLNGMYFGIVYRTKFGLTTFVFAEVLRLYPPVLVFFFGFHEIMFMIYVYVVVRLIAGMEVGSS